MNKKAFFFLLFVGFLCLAPLQAMLPVDGITKTENASTSNTQTDAIETQSKATQAVDQRSVATMHPEVPPPSCFLTQTLGQLAVNAVGAYGAWDLVRFGAVAVREALTANPPATILGGALITLIMGPALCWHHAALQKTAHKHSDTLWSMAKRTVQGFGLVSFGWGAWKVGQYIAPFVRAHQQSAMLFGAAALSGLLVPWLRDINFSDWLSKAKVRSPVTTATP